MTTLPKAGRYELLGELGRGAMGVVYRAQDPVIGRAVAVKAMRLSEEGTGMTHEELIARFQTEARAAGLLTHPNIVVVYDAGEEDGTFYITMELVEGRSLQALLDARQTFPLPRVLHLMEQTCSALEFAHAHNVIHRDIKPANIMLTSDDTVKITDFGTAKILQFGTTQTAQVVGTPSYMSPEQVKGKRIDGRSDIFSLGVVLYELVTGEKPFPGDSITTVIYKIINEDPIPPRELDSSVHPGLSNVVLRALAKDIDARYGTCGELMAAMRNYRDAARDTQTTLVMPAPIAGAAPASTVKPSPPPVAAFAAPSMPVRSVATALPAPKRMGSHVWLALLLVAVIVAASSRIWPYVREVWQKGRAARESSLPAPSPVSRPEASPSQPPRNSTLSPPPDRDAASTDNTAAADSDSVESFPKASSTGASGAEPRSTPEKKPPSQPSITLAQEVKTRIEDGLRKAGLGGKVSVEAAGNTISLAGQLNAQQHRFLLQQLHGVPPALRLIDHIEDSAGGPGDAGQPPTPSSRGAIDVATDTPNMAAVLRGPQGRMVSECRTPCRFKDLWPGTYALEINQAGYRPVERTLLVNAGSVLDERVEMQAIVPGVYVTSRPAGATVFINGEHQPEQTPTTIRLGAGTYNILVRRPGFVPYTGKIEVRAGEQAQLDVELAEGRGTIGWAQVNTVPRGADIAVDGVPTGLRTPTRLELPPGLHTLTLSTSGFENAERKIMVDEGQTVQVDATLRRQ